MWRSLDILVTDGADGAIVDALTVAAKTAGVSVKIVAPKVCGVTLKGGEKLVADEKIDGAPSVLFDAVAIVVSKDGAQKLPGERAALDFVSDAFAHRKAIGHTAEAGVLFDKAGAEPDDFFFDLSADVEILVGNVASRHWAREAKVKLPL